MRARQILNLEVVEVARGTTLGRATGVMIDADEGRVAAIAVSQNSLLGKTRYVPFEDLKSIENDVVTVPSMESAVERSSFKKTGMMDTLLGRKVLTQDGKDLGDVQDYSFDPKTGDMESITLGVNKQVLGGLWKSHGENYEVSRNSIIAFGEHVVVDNSVPEAVGLRRAA